MSPSETGIDFTNTLKEDTTFNIIEYLYFYNGGGVAVGDINNDGLVDVYFSSNQNPNRLYLNKGKFQFEDITDKAKCAGVGNWKTGVTLADVNGDGWLDIYICGVGNYKNFNSKNQLLINNHDLTFTDRTKEYGLDFVGLSTQAVFFDYDLDGDLDCYLLNHSVHSTRSLGDVSQRFKRDVLSGDKLFRNELIHQGKNGSSKFTDVSLPAGILQGALAYGLGVGVSDLNFDGYPDIYVSNDFQENDYLYLNRKDGTFKQILETSVGHSSRFSMGNDLADFNNDGRTDIVTLDMLPEEEDVIKTSAGDDPFETYMFKLRAGFHYQTARNCLQLNQFSSDTAVAFSDIAWLSNVAATDWSWSPLFADFDNDGWKDLFVTNGIMRRPNDMDYVSFISNDRVQKDLQKINERDLKIIEQMPSGKVSNFAFQNSGKLKFEDQTKSWGLDNVSISNGAAYADLDNDGDLDLLVNNINESGFVYKNNSVKNSFLKIKLEGSIGNSFGIGAKVMAYLGSEEQLFEVASTRGFCSSVDTRINIGLGHSSKVDSLIVVWPSGKMERKTDVAPNQTIAVKESDAKIDFSYNRNADSKTLLKSVLRTELPKFKHRENGYNAFNRENLMPQMLTTEGPALATADVTGDGLDDIFLGGGKGQSGEVFYQTQEGFVRSMQNDVSSDSSSEVIAAAFFDADKDGDNDLVVVSGGQEVMDSRSLLPRLYLNDGKGAFSRKANFVTISMNASCVKPCDFDKDGDVDLFIGASAMPLLYGMSPISYLLINDGAGNFSPNMSWLGASRFPSNMPDNRLGMVKDAVWTDVNKDGLPDLVAVGEWMPITVLIQKENHFENETNHWGFSKSSGLWNTIIAADFDGDGDDDLVAGNLGLNSRLKANEQKPLRMLVGDLDGNASTDHILIYFNKEKSYPFATRDQLVKQLPYLKKKFLKYKDYRNVTVRDILSPAQEGQSVQLRVDELQSVIARNDGQRFMIGPLPIEAQVSPVKAMYSADVNSDGKLDILLGGNLRAVQTELGPYDASYGLVLLGDGHGQFKSLPPAASGFRIPGEARGILEIRTSKKNNIFLVSRNNETLLGFRKATP
ncbi:MAG TPA: VCBS repeat-containing protein [Cyclobacteriaceae bacterium]|nr:VCBS repeat-containing protein [Cyclobacteriaceae bacterium]